MTASKSYIDRLAKDIAQLGVTHGGPILMVQVENEYGSYGSNHKYVGDLRDMLKEAFNLPLYTNDGARTVDD